MEDEKSRLWSRRLPASINDPETAERLNALADEYERRAQAAKDEEG